MVTCCYYVINLMERRNFRLFSDRDTDVCWLIMGKFIYFNVNVSTVLHSYILTEGNQQCL